MCLVEGGKEQKPPDPMIRYGNLRMTLKVDYRIAFSGVKTIFMISTPRVFFSLSFFGVDWTKHIDRSLSRDHDL